MASLLSGLSGLTDKITSFIREPVSSLGNAINDAINSTYGVVSNDKYLRFADMVNSTSDPEVLEEVWFVLAKGIGSTSNATVRTTMQICDVLMKNTGSRFHNSCTPLFMRRCKEMIIDRSKTGGADNMHVANDARNMIRLWGDAFMPYASSGRGRAIVEGYQDMQRDGIRFPPLPNDTKWEPSINPPRRVPEPTNNSYSSSSSYSSKPRKSSVAEEPAGDFDPKETYKMLKKLLVKYDNEGNSIFDNTKITTFIQNCIGNTRRLQRIIERESMKDDNETYLNHLLTLNDMFIKISTAYKKYQDSKKKAADDWSDDDAPVQKPKKKVTDDWSDDDSTPSSSIKVKASSSTASEGPAIRSTGRRTKREDSVSSNTTRQTSKKASDSLFDDDDDDSFSKKPSRVMNKNAAASLFDSDDEAPAPVKSKKTVSTDDWEDEWGASTVVKNPKPVSRKNINQKATDDLFGDDDDSFTQPQVKKQATKQSKKPVSDDPFGFDFMSSAPTVSEPNDIMDEMDIMNIDFTSTAASTTTTTKPSVVSKPVKTTKSKTAFDDLFDL